MRKSFLQLIVLMALPLAQRERLIGSHSGTPG